jgi:hypothetical protein
MEPIPGGATEPICGGGIEPIELVAAGDAAGVPAPAAAPLPRRAFKSIFGFFSSAAMGFLVARLG